MAELYGIETIKKAAEVVIKLGMRTEEALSDDGKIKFLEGVGLAIGAFPGVLDVVQNASQLKLEYNDLSDDERDELVSHIILELDLDADNLEEIIESGFEVLISLEKLITKIRESKVISMD